MARKTAATFSASCYGKVRRRGTRLWSHLRIVLLLPAVDLCIYPLQAYAAWLTQLLGEESAAQKDRVNRDQDQSAKCQSAVGTKPIYPHLILCRALTNRLTPVLHQHSRITHITPQSMPLPRRRFAPRKMISNQPFNAHHPSEQQVKSTMALVSSLHACQEYRGRSRPVPRVASKRSNVL